LFLAKFNELIIRESKQFGIFVDGLETRQICSTNDFLEMLKEGNDNRIVASTGFIILFFVCHFCCSNE
jgi:hypothetical protein